ncbi:hypothetical protein KBG31_02990 [Patescibacteria group bacterium]|nr:hypothetical protein [Patescibacteria group bacterium]
MEGSEKIEPVEIRMGKYKAVVEEIFTSPSNKGEYPMANGYFRSGEEIVPFHIFDGLRIEDRDTNTTIYLQDPEGTEIGRLGVEIDEFGNATLVVSVPQEHEALIEELTGLSRDNGLKIVSYGERDLTPSPHVKRGIQYLKAYIDLEGEDFPGNFGMIVSEIRERLPN